MRLRIANKWDVAQRDDGPFFTSMLGVAGGSANWLQVWVPYSVAEPFAPNCDKDPGPITDPVILLLLERISHIGEAGMAALLQHLDGKPQYLFRIANGDVPSMTRLVAEKSCKYQGNTDGERSCGVALSLQSNQANVLATTRYQCSICPVPDKRLACSNFSHARVFHRPGGTSIELHHALCELNRGEIAQDRTRCRPGGHECWEREVKFEQPADEPQHALALHELLEFVDARWKVAFRNHLLSSRRGLAFGKLATPCETSADFEAKLSALAQVMNSFDVPEKLLKDEHRGKPDYQTGRTFARLESALERALAEDPATVAVVKRAVAILRDANGLRNDAQHGNIDVASRYARFGLPYPPPPPSETWARVQSRVAQALHDLAGAIPDE